MTHAHNWHALVAEISMLAMGLELESMKAS